MSFIERLNAMIDSREPINFESVRHERQLLINVRELYLAEHPRTEHPVLTELRKIDPEDGQAYADAGPVHDEPTADDITPTSSGVLASPTQPQSAEEFLAADKSIPVLRCLTVEQAIAFAELYHQQASSSRWIACSERLPDAGQWCLVVYSGKVQRMAAHLAGKGFAAVDGYEWCWADEAADQCPLEEITHWLPLPPTP